jgi:hypothetical protein
MAPRAGERLKADISTVRDVDAAEITAFRELPPCPSAIQIYHRGNRVNLFNRARVQNVFKTIDFISSRKYRTAVLPTISHHPQSELNPTWANR